MGALEKIFPNWSKKAKQAKAVRGYFKMLNGYTPIWSTYDGGVYEMELTRACIHSFATHASKLLPTVTGPDKRGVQSLLDGKPNHFMTSSQFIYKVATILEAQNTCFIVPVLDQLDRLVGFYPVNPRQTEILDVAGEPWLRYTFQNGEKAAIELVLCGVVSKFLYNNDIKGETNAALNPTLQLLNMQNQGIAEGIKNSASYRFMATMSNFTQDEDLKNERKSWVDANMSGDDGGVALFPNTWTNIQQIQSAAKVVDPEQMELIQNRVYTYFGTNEKILRNEATGDDWSAYYEGKIEPFAIQLSQAMTCMTFTLNEMHRGNAITWSANRLQYMTNADKLQVSSQMFDRGIFSINDVMDIWNLPHVQDGDKRYIRKEYTEITQLDQVTDLQQQLIALQNQLNASKTPEPAPDPDPEPDPEIDKEDPEE